RTTRWRATRQQLFKQADFFIKTPIVTHVFDPGTGVGDCCPIPPEYPADFRQAASTDDVREIHGQLTCLSGGWMAAAFVQKQPYRHMFTPRHQRDHIIAGVLPGSVPRQRTALNEWRRSMMHRPAS